MCIRGDGVLVFLQDDTPLLQASDRSHCVQAGVVKHCDRVQEGLESCGPVLGGKEIGERLCILEAVL